MMELVFLRLHNQTGQREFWVRADHISEVHELQSSAVPYDVCGARVMLTTGRELIVSEMADDVLELVAVMLRKLNGEFDSETDSLG